MVKKNVGAAAHRGTDTAIDSPTLRLTGSVMARPGCLDQLPDEPLPSGWTVTWSTVTPRSASSSSTSRQDRHTAGTTGLPPRSPRGGNWKPEKAEVIAVAQFDQDAHPELGALPAGAGPQAQDVFLAGQGDPIAA
jgi:hypothetical protein